MNTQPSPHNFLLRLRSNERMPMSDLLEDWSRLCVRRWLAMAPQHGPNLSANIPLLSANEQAADLLTQKIERLEKQLKARLSNPSPDDALEVRLAELNTELGCDEMATKVLCLALAPATSSEIARLYELACGGAPTLVFLSRLADYEDTTEVTVLRLLSPNHLLHRSGIWSFDQRDGTAPLPHCIPLCFPTFMELTRSIERQLA